MKIHEVLNAIASIGVEIAKLNGDSRSLRMSLMDEYDNLPRATDGVTALVVDPYGRIARIRPCRTDSDNPESAVKDVTVTFERAYFTTDI